MNATALALCVRGFARANKLSSKMLTLICTRAMDILDEFKQQEVNMVLQVSLVQAPVGARRLPGWLGEFNLNALIYRGELAGRLCELRRSLRFLASFIGLRRLALL